MRFAHQSPGHTNSWTLAAAIALIGCTSLVGCGQGEKPADPAKPATAVKVDAGAPAAAVAPAAAPQPATTLEEGQPILGGVIEGPVEFEPVVEKPLKASFPEAPAPKAKPAAVEIPGEDVLMGRPLVIASKVIPFEDVKRAVCLDSIGVTEIEYAKMRIFIEEERARRRKEGASEEELNLSAAEMEGLLKQLEGEIKTQFPQGNVSVEDVLNGFGSADPRERLRMQRLFQKLFLPDDPDKFPPMTQEAIMSHDGGQSLIESCRERFKARMAEATPSAKNPDDQFLDSIILEQIVNYLRDKAQIQANPAPGVVFRVNGVDIKTDDVWNAIKPVVTTMEVRAAKQWITNVTLLQAALTKAGFWLNDEDAEDAYHLYTDPYKDSIFSIERIAVMLKRFPSIERFKEYRRIYESYKRMIAADMTQEKIDQLAQKRSNKLVGQVSADVDVILCSAYDFKAQRWKEDGWKDAENRMRDVLRLLVDEGRPWEELLEKYSEFYEAPVAVSEQAQLDPNRPLKGRFRAVQRNNMFTELGESVYSVFLNGSSITDFVFFEQEVGTLGDPMRGPMGWYLPRLIKRSKPPERLPLAPDALQQIKEEDYVEYNLDKFVQQLIADNEVYGLDLPGQQSK